MNEFDELNTGLREVAEPEPDSELERRLLAAFRAHHGRRNRRKLFLAEACGLLALVLATVWLQDHRHAISRSSLLTPAAGRGGQASDTNASTEFVVLPYGQSGVPMGDAIVMRVQLPASELSTLGIPVSPSQSAQRVNADLLIGQDGVARAARVIE